jgi:hypothetical protein
MWPSNSRVQGRYVLIGESDDLSSWGVANAEEGGTAGSTGYKRVLRGEDHPFRASIGNPIRRRRRHPRLADLPIGDLGRAEAP